MEYGTDPAAQYKMPHLMYNASCGAFIVHLCDMPISLQYAKTAHVLAYCCLVEKANIIKKHERLKFLTMSEIGNQTPKKKSKKKLILTIICICLAYCLIVSLFDNDGSINEKHNSEACDAAELYVQSTYYQLSGLIPATRSKVVYKNDTYTCVAVKYTITEDDWDTGYWMKFVCVTNSFNTAVRATDEVRGVDYDNISDELINELKVLWQLQ